MKNAELSKGMKNLERLPEGTTIELINDNIILKKSQRGDIYRWMKDNYYYLPATYIVERGYRVIDQEARNIYISGRMNELNRNGILTIENVLTLLDTVKQEAKGKFYLD